MPDFWDELELEVEKLVAHVAWGLLPALDAEGGQALLPRLSVCIVRIRKWPQYNVSLGYERFFATHSPARKISVVPFKITFNRK